MIKEQQKKAEIGTVKKQGILENQAKIVFLGIGSNLGLRKTNIEFYLSISYHRYSFPSPS